MSRDPYRYVAGRFDNLIETMFRGLRLAGLDLYPPSGGMAVLDVGCGTGAHLALCQRYGCELTGLDRSPSMLAAARRRLGDSAQLDLGDAAGMPYRDGQFDLILCMLSLHEMPPVTRSAALGEMVRALRKGGRMLLTDFQPGPVDSPQGWIPKALISLVELAAGREHHRNYRHFTASGGLGALATQHGLRVEKQRILAGGTCAVYLASPDR